MNTNCTINKEHNNKKIIGSRIRQLRIKFNISIDELANKLDLSPAYIGLLERGQRGTSLINLIKISKLFNVSLDYFIDDNDKVEKEVTELDTIKFLLNGLTAKEINFFKDMIRSYNDLKKNTLNM